MRILSHIRRVLDGFKFIDLSGKLTQITEFMCNVITRKHTCFHSCLRYLPLSIILSVFVAPAHAAGNNILIIIADDLGVDMLGMYGRGSDIPQTPNIDALKKNGVMFRNAWSNPYCSPTRATIQTGQYSFRTGVGFVVLPGNNNGLPLADPSIIPLPRVFNRNPGLGYRHAAIGKWHLSNKASSLPCPNTLQCPQNAPNDAGWSYFSGNWSYMGGANVDEGLDDYFAWQKLENGIRTPVGNANTKDPSAYATTVNVNDALRWVQDPQKTGPWLLYLAFNSPHFPYHLPPANLYCPDALFNVKMCTRDLVDTDPDNLNPNIRRIKYKAMIQAMDTEIGRLIDTLGPSVMAKTTIIFLGDNGTPSEVTVEPFKPDHAKGSLFEGGINVPLIISGANVKSPNRESTALVNTTDLYATVLDLAGVDLQSAFFGFKLDSISLKPILDYSYNRSLRKYLYAELFNFGPSWTRAIRNEKVKLIRTYTNKDINSMFTSEYYDLVSDPFEQNKLIATALTAEQQRYMDDLGMQLDALAAGRDKWSVPKGSWTQDIINFFLN